jgi:hypothetical protein
VLEYTYIYHIYLCLLSVHCVYTHSTREKKYKMGGQISTLGQTQGGRVAGVVGFTQVAPFCFYYYFSTLNPELNPVRIGSDARTKGITSDENQMLMNRFAVQAAFAAYSVPAQSDKFYDLAGSLGFLSTTLVSLVRLFHSR